jgi:peroxiredoxin
MKRFSQAALVLAFGALSALIACRDAEMQARSNGLVGSPAPAFTLTDSNGAERSLADYRGKYVVLEWINHDCPYVRKHYGAGNMQNLQRSYAARGVIWLSINSSAPGKQGHFTPAEINRLQREKNAAPAAYLIDSAGTVGRAYGAQTTPHMFIINPEGAVIYQGAIDSNSSSDPATIAGADNYVRRALDEALSGKAVSLTSTRSYGCSVKY